MEHKIALDARIFVAGHRGLAGSAIVRRLESLGYDRILTATRSDLDLRNQDGVDEWFHAHRPEYVVVAAGTVGGIAANASRPAEFLYDNLMIQANVVHASHQFGVRRLLDLGSSCIYPRQAPQPIVEEALLSGPLEPTNAAYALAKICGVGLCASYREQYGCDFISAMPASLYGPGDNFELESAHVLPALIRRFHEAKLAGHSEVTVWGSGLPLREFLHVDDLADSVVFLLRHYDGPDHINVGTGTDVSIAELAQLVRSVVYPEAEVVFDRSRPDGTPRKVLDVSRLAALGWKAKTALAPGIAETYAWFVAHETSARGMAPVGR